MKRPYKLEQFANNADISVSKQRERVRCMDLL